jgi:hypothetical protein
MDKHDENLLLMVAAHEAVVASQGAAWLQLELTETERRLEALLDHKLVSRLRLSDRSPAVYRITPEGSAHVDAALPALGAFDPQSYRHQIAVGWLWAGAKRGAFGPVREVLSFREMVASDMSLRSGALLNTESIAFVTDEGGEHVALGVRYPDLAIVVPEEWWLPMFVVLSEPDLAEIARAIERYGQDPYMSVMTFFVEDKERFWPEIVDLATRAGFNDKVRFHIVSPDIDGG